MDKFNEKLFEMIGRSRNVNRGSKAASVTTITMSMEDWAKKDKACANTIDRIIRQSKAASIPRINKVQVIHDFIRGFELK